MILNSLEQNTTDQSNAPVDELVSVLTKEIEAKESAKQAKNQQRNPSALGKTYLRIL